MDFLTSHDNESWERFLAWLIMMLLIYFILFREDKEIRRGFKGDNENWELPEAIGYAFLYLLPGVLISAFFLKWQIDEKVMFIIDTILLAALGIRGAIDGVKHWKKGTDSEEDKKENPPAG